MDEDTAVQAEPTYTEAELEAMRDFRKAGWTGPLGEQRQKVERGFDSKVSALQALLDAAVDEPDKGDMTLLASAFIRRVRKLRAETEGYQGLSINRIDVAKVGRY